MKHLLALGMAMSLSVASYAAQDDDDDLCLPLLKGCPLEMPAETRAFGDLPYGLTCVPHEGHVRVPIIMVEFPDRRFTFGRDVLYDLYMGQHPIEERPTIASSSKGYGYGSAQEYFYESSFGKLDFEFEFFGPYTLPNTHEYYGKKTGQTHRRLLDDALPLVEDDIDFAQYDNDGDGLCDIVYFLYAGEGANNTADLNDIWPSCALRLNHETKDGVKINHCGTSNELLLPAGNSRLPDGRALINGIGVFCHELSHGMGLPDLYYYTESWSCQDNNGPEVWDLMDAGENVRNGFWPVLYSAWERMIFGWLEPVELTTEQDVTVWPLNDEAGRGKAYVVRHPDNPDEFWTIENIPSTGWYAGMYGGGTGIIIGHIYYSDDCFAVGGYPNSAIGKPRCTILPADGWLLSSSYINKTHPDGMEVTSTIYNNNLRGDPYPGSTGVTSLAAYHNYTGDEDLVNTLPITNICMNGDGSVSFHFGGDASGIRQVQSPGTDEPVYDLSGRRVRQMRAGGIYIRGGVVRNFNH